MNSLTLRRATPRAIGLILVLASLTGCAGPNRKDAVPEDLVNQAVVPGMPPGIRTWGYTLDPAFRDELIKSIQRERDYRAKTGQTGPLPPAEYLAISGGGANGAFTAGLLNGWTKRGDRPTFKAVTGISTGALISPFAFVGPQYDDVMKAVYTQTSTKDIMTKRGLLAGLFDDALADNKPLWHLTDKYINEKLLEDIATEYSHGRILMVGTTNLDARRGVIWNVGLIASSGSPEALHLIRSILIASAAIPAAFPPVMIDVEVNGKKYTEMHVDGGTVAQVFLFPPNLHLKELAQEYHAQRTRRAYIIRNSRIDPDWAEVEPRTLTIAGQAIQSLLRTQGIGDLYRIYINCQKEHVDYNLGYIPDTFNVKPKEVFDRAYMNQLYDVGFKMAKNGYPWKKYPPGYSPEP